MSNLFDLTTFVEVAPTNQSRVKTPLGPLVLEVIVLEQRGSKVAHKHFIDEDNQGEAFVFSFEEASTELLGCPTKTWLPNGMTIEQCLGWLRLFELENVGRSLRKNSDFRREARIRGWGALGVSILVRARRHRRVAQDLTFERASSSSWRARGQFSAWASRDVSLTKPE
jgi:hypothetical protein